MSALWQTNTPYHLALGEGVVLASSALKICRRDYASALRQHNPRQTWLSLKSRQHLWKPSRGRSGFRSCSRGPLFLYGPRFPSFGGLTPSKPKPKGTLLSLAARGPFCGAALSSLGPHRHLEGAPEEADGCGGSPGPVLWPRRRGGSGRAGCGAGGGGRAEARGADGGHGGGLPPQLPPGRHPDRLLPLLPSQLSGRRRRRRRRRRRTPPVMDVSPR